MNKSKINTESKSKNEKQATDEEGRGANKGGKSESKTTNA
jgi:hypothetical protein